MALEVDAAALLASSASEGSDRDTLIAEHAEAAALLEASGGLQLLGALEVETREVDHLIGQPR